MMKLLFERVGRGMVFFLRGGHRFEGGHRVPPPQKNAPLKGSVSSLLDFADFGPFLTKTDHNKN